MLFRSSLLLRQKSTHSAHTIPPPLWRVVGEGRSPCLVFHPRWVVGRRWAISSPSGRESGGAFPTVVVSERFAFRRSFCWSGCGSVGEGVVLGQSLCRSFAPVRRLSAVLRYFCLRLILTRWRVLMNRAWLIRARPRLAATTACGVELPWLRCRDRPPRFLHPAASRQQRAKCPV